MNRRNKKCFLIICFKLAVIISTTTLSLLPFCECFPIEGILLKANPAIMKNSPSSVKSQFHSRYLASRHQFKSKQTLLPWWPEPDAKNYFQIEPADAIDSAKYSQPAIDHHKSNPHIGQEVPLKTFSRVLPSPASNQSAKSINMHYAFNPNSSTPSRDLRFLESSSQNNSKDTQTEYSLQTNKLNVPQSDMQLNRMPPNLDGKNLTEKIKNLLPLPSETVLTYESPTRNMDTSDSKYILAVKKNSEQTFKDISSHLDAVKSEHSDPNHSTLLALSPQLNTEPSAMLSTHIYSELLNKTESTDSPAFSTLPSSYEVENVSSSLASFDVDEGKLSSGSVAGIVIGVLVCVTILSSSVIYLLYRRYNGKCTSVVESKFNSDNCGYLDDSLRSSIYLNNHIELPKESSEEMSSLDNDSFLNSLETMTIQNYWADTSKNTKV